jgi:C_GCAxxG_C_C family probable redox protein
MNSIEQAVACFKTNFNCAQSIISTYGPKTGIDQDYCLKISEVFGGGMASTRNVCGVVTGAFMAIGLNYGRTRGDDELAKEKSKERAIEFIDKFKDRNDTILCNELISFDVSTPENKELAIQKCTQFV